MAVTVARVHLAVAHAALPALLPTPPKSMMLPLLPTPPCVAVLPVSPAKTSRADADERWDAHKTKPAATASPAALGQRSSTADGKNGGPGRASSCERWDSNKKSAASSSFSSSSSGIGSASTRASATSTKWESNKCPVVVSRASSAARWDAHKKPRPLQAAVLLVDDGVNSTGSNDVEMEEEPPQRAPYAGPGFVVASPEPSMIPMPAAFLVRVA
ncbi:hypothetical protein ACP4OV_003210 [Aristida adscensionis]